ncbi:uncharacterized protein LOC121504132 [Cheilinus undulatus]|uniref:uncharacterized protein LOC121504132 n=1 Tax=Cheilinus undulatus TaxID=241271 RepID=UPI001BD5A75A|nr:uncharacterized protein LOC121504132 [Cheilinus undulatus]
MLENLALNLRLFVLVCAAVMSFIMCPDAARVSPITTQVENRVKYKVLRQLYTPNSLHHHFVTGPLSTETGFQSGSSSKTENVKHFKKTSSIINRQSKPLTGGGFGYNQNNPDNRHSHAGITRVQSGKLPENSIFTSNNQHERDGTERPQTRANYHTTTGNVYSSYPAIIRKSSRHKASSPFYQSSSHSQVAQESYKVPMIDFSNQAEDKTTWQSSYSSPFSSQTRSASLPAQRRHYSSDKETNELPGSLVQSASRAIQSRKYQSFTGQTAPHAPSISKSVDINVIKSNPRIKSPISSITDFSQGWRSLGSTETPRLNIQSYLFKDSQTSSGGYQSVNTKPGSPPAVSHMQQPSGAQVNGNFLSNIQQKSTTKYVKHPSVYQTADGSHTHRLLQSHRTSVVTGIPTSVHPVPGIDDTRNTFLPNPHANIQVNFATVNKESSSPNATTSGSMQTPSPGRNNKNIYGFRGFQNPPWRSLKEPSTVSPRGLNEGTNSLRYRYGNRKFKTTNVYPSISRKYSFSQRGQFPTTTPPELERQQTSTPGARDTIQTLRNPGPITSVSKEAQPLVPKSDAGSNENKKFRMFRRIYGLKGFSKRPLEGAKGSLSEPDKSKGVQEDLGGLKFRSPQVLQPISKRIQRFQYNKTDKIEPGSNHGSTISESEPKKHFETSGGTESVDGFSPNRYKEQHKLFNFPGFQLVRNRFGNALNETTWKYKSGGTPSTFVGSAGPLQAPHPRTSNSTRPVPMRATLLNSSTSSTVRGKRVKVKQVDTKGLQESNVATNNAGNVAIVRMPKPHARVKAFTFSDILGSASFSSVRATTQTPITPTGEDSIGNITAATKQEVEVVDWTAEDEKFSRDNSSRDPEDESEDFSHVEKNEQDVRSKDTEFKTDLFLDNEGSGSGDLNMFDVFSTKSNRLSEDLLELDYLRISAGNVSFKSMNVSRSDQMRA